MTEVSVTGAGMPDRQTDAGESALPDSIVRAAIGWRVRLQSGDAGAAEEQACHEWRQRDARHELAWQQLLVLENDFAALADGAPGIAYDALSRAETVRGKLYQRRQVIKGLGLAGLALGSGWLVAPHWQADYATGVGERRRLVLEDGSVIWLNTDSAINVSFTTAQRVIALRKGDVHIQTARDSRPMTVQVRQGTVQPIGTRFLVRRQPDAAYVRVTEGAVVLRPRDHRVSATAAAGTAFYLARDGVRPVPDTDTHFDTLAWLDGTLVARGMPLAAFLTELERHRPGWIYCADAVANLQVSGVFQLHDVDGVLESVAEALSIRLLRGGRYWAALVPV